MDFTFHPFLVIHILTHQYLVVYNWTNRGFSRKLFSNFGCRAYDFVSLSEYLKFPIGLYTFSGIQLLQIQPSCNYLWIQITDRFDDIYISAHMKYHQHFNLTLKSGCLLQSTLIRIRFNNSTLLLFFLEIFIIFN